METSELGQWLADEGFEKGLAPELAPMLEKALTAGIEFSEFFFESSRSTRIIYEGEKVDRVLAGQDQGVGIRMICRGKQVYGYSTDLSLSALEGLNDRLIISLESEASQVKTTGAQKLKTFRPSRAAEAGISDYAIKRSPHDLALKEKITYLKRADVAARAALRPPIKTRQVSAVWIDTERKIVIVNSDSQVARDRKTLLHFVVEAIGEKDGRVESTYESDGGFVGLEFFDENSPEQFGKEAARKVTTLLDALPAPSGEMTIVLSSEAGGTMIHEAVGHGLEADLACNGLSVYANQLGQKVASPLISVLDDGTMPARRGSYRYDDEGTPSQPTTLIENGILKSYLVDRLSGMKFDLMATGNGRRESFRHKPIVRMTNTYIAPGKDDPAAILRDTKFGLYVKGMGGGQVNTVTGDFVFAVTEAYLIRDGKLAEPVRGATLVGNGPNILQAVDRVGNDLGFATGTCGKDGQGAPVTDAQPTLRIPKLTVGGEVPVATYM